MSWTVVAANPPLPTPCLPGTCGAAAQSFVQYGAATATVIGAAMNITQSSNQAILNWQNFNIANGYRVNFQQPSATAAALNKIWSADPSLIAGSLTSNGQVYLINQNGIIFDRGAQVNVGGLVASGLGLAGAAGSNDPDALFKGGLLSNNSNAVLSNTLPAIFQSTIGTDGKPLSGAVTVNPGAALTTADGGRIMLLGSMVTNGGSITSPDGQTILGAGNTVYLAASNDPSLRGLLIQVDAGGTAANFGRISSPRGNVTLAGMVVNQAGQISATTSVSVNGSIFLIAGDASSINAPNFVDADALGFGGLMPNVGGTLTLAPASVTQVLPDATGNATISQQNLPNFIPSQVELVGQSVALQGNAAVQAPGATVRLGAATNPYVQFQNASTSQAGSDGGRIYLDTGSTIDVSGLSNVSVAATNNIVSVTLEGNDLQDDPLLRNGFLHGQAVTVNVDQGSTLFDASPYAGNIPVGIQQVLTTAGKIQLDSDGDVIARAGSTLNVAGGSVAFQGGYGSSTTKLLGADGKVYDISSAPNTIEYVGLANSYSYTDPTWGTKTAQSSQSYYPGYIKGANAGEIDVTAPQMYLRSTLDGQTVTGVYQRNLNALPLGGLLQLGCDCADGGNTDFRAPAVQFAGNGADLLGANFDYQDLSKTLSPDLQNLITLSPGLLSQGGFSRLTVFSNGSVNLPAGGSLNLGTNGKLAVTSDQSIGVYGSILAPGGAIDLETQPRSAGDVSAHNIQLGGDASIDVSGTWTNDSPGVSPAAGTGPLVLNGGSVKLNAAGDVSLAGGSVVDVSGGGWIDTTNKLSAGNAGQIILSATLQPASNAPFTGLVDLEAGASLIGNSLKSGGGTLSITSGSVTVGNIASDTPGELLLSPDFFSNRGFHQYNITGLNDVLIGGADDAGPVVVNPIQDTLAFTQNALLRPTGTSLDSFTQLQALPPSQRSAANISFTATSSNLAVDAPLDGSVVLGSKASILTDPGASVTLASKSTFGSVTVLGSIVAPSGDITLQIGAPTQVVNPSGLGYVAGQRVELGPDSLLNAAASPRIDTLDPQGYREGSVLAGGTVSLQAYRGYVVTDPGATIDVSGAAAVLDVVNAHGVTPTTVAGNAGTINIDAREGLVLQGNLEAHAAAIGGVTLPGASAGSLTIGLDLFDYVGAANANQNVGLTPYPLDARTLTLSSLAASQLPTEQHSGSAWISTPMIAAGGFDSVTLKSADAIAVDGDVALSTKSALTLDAPVLQGNADSSLRLNSAYVALGNYFNESDYFDASLVGTKNPNIGAVLAPGCGAAPQCSATLAANAQMLDVRGVSGWNGFGSTVLSSSGDLRFVAAQNPFNTPPAIAVPAGDTGRPALRAALNLTGDLILQAQQAYPTTNSDFTISSPASVTVSPAGATAATPLSAGGALTINAPTITQAGTLRAPFGQITLNGLDTVSAVDGTTIPGSVTLASGSVTSVSADGLVIPYGSTVNGQQWAYVPDSAITQVIGTPPAKAVNLTGSNIAISSGATIDLSGGGDLYAYEWIAGPGGSADVLDPLTGAYQYAIIPALSSHFSPLDAQYQLGSPATGNQTIYLSGLPGLAAGFYALLPARYALLPGAYAIGLVKANSDIAPGSVVQRPDGTIVASAQFGVAGTNVLDSRTSTVLVASSSVVDTQSQYTATYGNTFFSSAAATAGTAAPQLPADAGALQISAANSLALNGAVKFGTGSFVSGKNADGSAASTQGEGGNVSIEAPQIVVVDASSQPNNAEGALQIEVKSLNDLDAQTLALGATVLKTTAGEQITTGSTLGIELENAQTALAAPQIILAAQDQIALDAGAKVNATGSLKSSPSALVLNGGGALLLALSGASAPLDASATSGTTGLLSIGSHASLQATGSLVLFSTGNTSAQPDATIAAPALGLYSSRVSLGDIPSGDASPAGLNITAQLLGQFTNLTDLTIGSTSTIDLYGAVDLGGVTSRTHSLSNITLDAWSVDGYGTNDKTLQAGSITLANSNAGSPPVAAPDSPSGSGALSLIAAATGTDAGQITLGAGAKILRGFDAVTLDAAGAIQSQGTGSLALAGAAGATVPVVIQSAALVSSAGSDQRIVTDGSVTLNQAAAGQAGNAAAALGGKLLIQGSSITQNGTIDLPAGILTLHATAGDVTLGQGSMTRAAGATQGYVVTDAVADAGKISLLADQGNVVLAAGATLDLSGAAAADGSARGNAGSLDIEAPNGRLINDGSGLKGGAPAGQLAGNASVDVGSGLGGSGFSALESALSASGFTGAVSVRTRGDALVDVTGTVRASSFDLTVDQGSIVVAGTISTSGGDAQNTNGGPIALWAGHDLTLAAGSALLADAGAAGLAGVNGVAAVARGGDITLGSAAGTISIAGGTAAAPTTLSMRGSGGAESDGTLTIRATRTGDGADVQINTIGQNVTVNSRQAINVEAYKAYQATDLGDDDTGCGTGGSCDVSDLSGRLFADGSTLMANQADVLKRLGFTNNAVQLSPAVEVDSSTDLILDANWDLNSWNAALGAPVDVTLRAAGNLIFDSSLSDGFTKSGNSLPKWIFGSSAANGQSASYRLVGGADLSSANPIAVEAQLPSAMNADGIPNFGNVIVTPGQLIRTGTGNIAIAAGGDLLLGFSYDGQKGASGIGVTESDPLSAVIYTAGIPSVLGAIQAPLFTASTLGGFTASYPTMGGDIVVDALGDIRSAPSIQLASDWLWRRGIVTNGSLVSPSKNPSWWVTFGNFNQGIGALGGGDLTLTAGGDIRNTSAVIPTTGRLLGAAGTVPDLSNLILTGGGHLQVQAGGDIKSGVFEDDWGNAQISAGGGLNSGTTVAQELSGLDLSDLSASAANAPIFPILLMGSGSFNVDARTDTQINFVGNSTTLPELTANSRPAGGNAYIYTYAPATALNITSSGGNVVLMDDISNLPVNLQAIQNTSFGQRYVPQPYTVVYPGTLQVASLSGDIGVNTSGLSGTGLNLFPSATGNLNLLANGSINGGPSLGMTKGLLLTMFETDPASWPNVAAPGTTTNLPAATVLPRALLHLDDLAANNVIAATGSIAPATMVLPKAANIIAGDDILDLTYSGKNLRPSDVTLIEAGGNVNYSTPTDPVTNALQVNGAGINLAGPGFLEVLAGGSVNLGDSSGIVASGSLSDSRLTGSGASLVVGAGFGRNSDGSMRQPASAAFVNAYLSPQAGKPSGYAADLIAYMQQLGTTSDANLDYATALADFESLATAQQLPFLAQVLSNELSETGLAHTLQGASYDRGYAAIETLFPSKAVDGTTLAYKGDIGMFFSQIKTQQGGNINLLAPGGSVVVGVPNPPAALEPIKEGHSPFVAAAANLGLLVLGAGKIEGFADQDFEVNRSRILTLEGGDIILWASNGSIDAGRGAKTASGAPPPVISTDSNGNVFVNPINDVSGSGIGQLLTGPGQVAGLVNLIAPRGTVDAGDAGIRVAGNLNIAAVQVIGAGNISVSGTSSGVPTSEAGALSGALSGANSLGDAGKTAMDQVAQGLGNATTFQQLTDSLTPAFVVVRMFCLGVACEVQ